jgi:hypothetical protein
MCVMELGMAKNGAPELRSIQMRINEIRVFQMRIPKLRSIQMRTKEIRVFQMRILKLRSAQIRVTKIESADVAETLGLRRRSAPKNR